MTKNFQVFLSISHFKKFTRVFRSPCLRGQGFMWKNTHTDETFHSQKIREILRVCHRRLHMLCRPRPGIFAGVKQNLTCEIADFTPSACAEWYSRSCISQAVAVHWDM